MTTVIGFMSTPDGTFGVLAEEGGAVLASGWTDSEDALLARLRPERRPASLAPGWAPAFGRRSRPTIRATSPPSIGSPSRSRAGRSARRRGLRCAGSPQAAR
ncbi:hypothetical protein GCM10025866_23460 [Naasia aerilata]|uniref:Uncharacterized protein n=1 Tax=Naasia aerilata TaxID=1162966 RepID=A0ABM8GDS9_9MICO|nr:hypothetical protein GCM10025866_23460 [Naasia aerilata]